MAERTFRDAVRGRLRGDVHGFVAFRDAYGRSQGHLCQMNRTAAGEESTQPDTALMGLTSSVGHVHGDAIRPGVGGKDQAWSRSLPHPDPALSKAVPDPTG
ncbi:hypothetical protein GCM10018966_016610 [Streptomyces yanii]